MSDESNKKQMSRRTFLKGMGAGVVGTPLVISNLEAVTPKGLQAEEIPGVEKQPVSLKVNGKNVRVAVEPRSSLAELLRNDLRLTGTKVVCNHGECGNCTVLLDGKAVYACHMLALDAMGKDVTTIEGLLSGEELHPVQKAFWEKDGFQCGFCTPGQIMSAHALLLKYPNPTREQILQEMSGNICRCAAYPKILESVMAAAEGSTG